MAQPFHMIDRSGQQQKSHRQRLSAALRENLRRRKAQAKGRTAGGDAGRPAANPGLAQERGREPHDSAGISKDK